MEALGGAASVIGVASLAIQVCEELKKVHNFWQSVKEAPDDIAQISAEINLFITLLALIANKYQQQGFDPKKANHVAAMDTLKLCLATVQNMNDGVENLERWISKGSSTRRWASIKFVFRKDKREKLMKQIERMKTLLIIVQTCYNGEMQEASFRSLSVSLRPGSALQASSNTQIFDTLTAAASDQGSFDKTQTPQPISKLRVGFDPKPSPQATRPSRRGRAKRYERAYNFGLAVLRFVTTEQESVLVEESGSERRVLAWQTRYDLRLAQWLLSHGFSWQTYGIYGSWQYSFRAFRYVPSDALIVDFCVDGDVANVQRMFEKGLASPFDRVRYRREDWSLLHFGIANCNVQLCNFLIECGLGHGSASGMSRKPILSLVGGRGGVPDSSTHLDILRIMVNEGQYDPMEEDRQMSVMHSFDGSPAVYRWLLEQEEFLIDLEPRASDTYSITTALIMSTSSNSSSYLQAAIAHQSNFRYPGRLDSPDYDYWLAQFAVYSLTHRAGDVDFPKRVKVLWDAGADFHTPGIHDSFGTTLDLLFSIFGWRRSDGNYAEMNYQRCEVEQTSIPSPPLWSTTDVIEYDRLEDISAIEYRPRTSKSLWRTWYPGKDLSLLEVAQRWLDAWMEILLEAGLDIAEYGRREDELHPEGLLFGANGDARVYFEYGEHVSGCRIHVTEVWLCDDTVKKGSNAKASTMPGSWEYDDA